jgi:hypothetical protein
MKNKNSKKIYIMLKCKWLLTLQRSSTTSRPLNPFDQRKGTFAGTNVIP